MTAWVSIIVNIAAIGSAFLVGRWWIKAARLKNTMDIFSQYETSAFYEKCYQVFRQARRENKKLTYESENKEQQEKIDRILNFYEMVAAAIYRGALDEKTSKIYFASAILCDYQLAQPYIKEAREITGDKELFIEFEKLYNEWQYGREKWVFKHFYALKKMVSTRLSLLR